MYLAVAAESCLWRLPFAVNRTSRLRDHGEEDASRTALSVAAATERAVVQSTKPVRWRRGVGAMTTAVGIQFGLVFGDTQKYDFACSWRSHPHIGQQPSRNPLLQASVFEIRANVRHVLHVKAQQDVSQPATCRQLTQVCIAAVGKLLFCRTRRHHEKGETTRASGQIVEHRIQVLRLDVLEHVSAYDQIGRCWWRGQRFEGRVITPDPRIGQGFRKRLLATGRSTQDIGQTMALHQIPHEWRPLFSARASRSRCCGAALRFVARRSSLITPASIRALSVSCARCLTTVRGCASCWS